MTDREPRSIFDRLGEHPLARVAVYYVALFAATALGFRFVPWLRGILTAQDYGAATVPVLGGRETAVPVADEAGVATVLAVTIGSVVLMLPVAWVYALTRSKQGYRQTLVQTILVLPVVVAGVVVVVKNSLALAFGLAGIVAAVSFRNRLEDSKDAVYVFLATAVGLACGVQAADIAAAITLVFNALVVFLWWSDFGRVPGALQGSPAEQRLRRALALANRTHQFVSMMDNELLRSLAPDQLEQVAGRVAQRQERLAKALDVPTPAKPLTPLHLRLAAGHPTARPAVEAVLAADTKRWQLVSANAEAGAVALHYELRLRKKVPAPLLEQRLRDAAGPALEELRLGPRVPA